MPLLSQALASNQGLEVAAAARRRGASGQSRDDAGASPPPLEPQATIGLTPNVAAHRCPVRRGEVVGLDGVEVDAGLGVQWLPPALEDLTPPAPIGIVQRPSLAASGLRYWTFWTSPSGPYAKLMLFWNGRLVIAAMGFCAAFARSWATSAAGPRLHLHGRPLSECTRRPSRGADTPVAVIHEPETRASAIDPSVIPGASLASGATGRTPELTAIDR